jgi:hypothetical protein
VSRPVELAAAPVSAEPAATASATNPKPSTTDVAPAPVAVAADASVKAPPETAKASATCVDKIEEMLVNLRTSAETDESWSTQQEELTGLVQATLDCEGAGFRVAGSLELVGSGLADLKVHWDRNSKVLDLAMIDRVEGSAAKQPAQPDDKAIEFVIR